MKGFERENQLFSLCGLNCGLCPMFLGEHCGGCGNGNQSCRIARCSLEHGKVEYCYECSEYPCDKYQNIDEFDSFITHKRQRLDMKKAKKIGIERYNEEQTEKRELLHILLTNYNDGRRKTFYCLAVNLLETAEVKVVLKQVSEKAELSAKEKTVYVVDELQSIAKARGIVLKLHKKK